MQAGTVHLQYSPMLFRTRMYVWLNNTSPIMCLGAGQLSVDYTTRKKSRSPNICWSGAWAVNWLVRTGFDGSMSSGQIQYWDFLEVHKWSASGLFPFISAVYSCGMVSALREYRSLSTLQEQTRKDLNAEVCANFPETIALTGLIFQFQSTTKNASGILSRAWQGPTIFDDAMHEESYDSLMLPHKATAQRYTFLWVRYLRAWT